MIARIISVIVLLASISSIQDCKPADIEQTAPAPADTTKYSCTGKAYCSQMSSCAEAKYYLEHCPFANIDGDGDGIPCEDQWCGH